MTDNKLYTSLSANTIHHGLTGQSRLTGQIYNIIDWRILFTWLWRWLPLRLSKRQSPTTVLFRPTLTRTIIEPHKDPCFNLPIARDFLGLPWSFQSLRINCKITRSTQPHFQVNRQFTLLVGQNLEQKGITIKIEEKSYQEWNIKRFQSPRLTWKVKLLNHAKSCRETWCGIHKGKHRKSE